MKLELKHLAPYLAYGLKCYLMGEKDEETDKPIQFLIKGASIEFVEVWSNFTITDEWHYEDVFPILRPLSDLTKEIEHNGEKIKVYELLEVDSCDIEFIHFENNSFFHNQTIIKPTKCEFIYAMDVYNNIIQELLKYHFDIFNLIPQGLAIDINTLK